MDEPAISSRMRISKNVLASAIAANQQIEQDLAERRLDAIYASQPNLLASVLSVTNLGASKEELEFLLRLLLICFEAMERSPFTWETITEDDQDRNLSTVVGTARLSEGLDNKLQTSLVEKVVREHSEKYLFAFVTHEIQRWAEQIAPERLSKFVLMCALNLVECIANGTAKRQPGKASPQVHRE